MSAVSSTAPLVSVIVPSYNDGNLLPRSLRRLAAVTDLDREVIVVDDGSTDGTDGLQIRLLEEGLADRWFVHPVNRGKGSAIHSALAEARGEIVAIHDADLEYDPGLLPKLVAPILAERADAVFGSRLLGALEQGSLPLPGNVVELVWGLGSEVVNAAVCLAARRLLTDVETCQKVVRTDLLRSLNLSEERFGFEPEVVIKLARSGARMLELPITYEPRTWAEGKKITIRDGFEALGCALRYGVLRD